MDLNKIQALAEPILRDIGCEWVEGKIVFEHGRRILRLLVDKEGGVTVGDCEKISREVGVVLDVEGAVTDRYVLEVSSPGINRPLVKAADYLKYLGKTASLKTREPIDGRRNYKGVLKKFENDEVEILIDGKTYRVPFALIEKAKLDAA